MNARMADVSSSQGSGTVAAIEPASPSSGPRFRIAIGLAFRQQAFGQALTTAPPAQGLQGIVGDGHDPDGLAVVQPDQMNATVYVVAPPDGRRNDGLPATFSAPNGMRLRSSVRRSRCFDAWSKSMPTG
jgi:hypothetical protein